MPRRGLTLAVLPPARARPSPTHTWYPAVERERGVTVAPGDAPRRLYDDRAVRAQGSYSHRRESTPCAAVRASKRFVVVVLPLLLFVVVVLVLVVSIVAG